MQKNTRLTIYNEAIVKWGREPQMDMAVEECAELIKAVNKFKRHKTPMALDNLLEEIADVEIMMEQLKFMLSKENAVDLIKEEKLNRLQALLLR